MRGAYTINLVGGRGYSGSELLRLVSGHPQLELGVAVSRSHAGAPISDECDGWPMDGKTFTRLEPDGVAAHPADAWVLAMPNGLASGWAGCIRDAQKDAVILDLSADYRFDDSWIYGLPERNRQHLGGARAIANPGCYATGAQLGLLPLAGKLAAPPSVFGVSGYSGAGKTPSPRNDPERLRNNLMAYSLAGHVHEREVSHQLGVDVRFMPHVAAFFRGISLTISFELDGPTSVEHLRETYRQAYGEEPRVKILNEPPEVRGVQNTPDVHIGGFTMDARDPKRGVLVVALDNLLKGAASQAMQNLNLALGLDEFSGLEPG